MLCFTYLTKCFKIKVLKRNAYGYRNFGRFRNRILHMFSYKNDLAKQGR
ncbi:transposase [Lachnospiraceae bacterium MD329]|nr:transposase [Lachnospiraceae bacterium MD329]